MALKPLNSAGGFSVGENKANVILANGDITTSNITLTGNLAVANANLGNLVTANYITATITEAANSQPNITSVGNLTSLTVTGNATAGNLIATGEVSGNTANFGGNVVVGAIQTSVFYTAGGQSFTPAAVTGSNQQVFFNDGGTSGADSGLTFDKTSGDLTVGGEVSANTISATSGANLGAVSNVKMSGGSDGQYLKTDGAGNLSFASIDTAKISNGNSNVDVSTSGGNVTVGVGGTGNVAVISSSGANITGTLGVSSTVTAGNLSVSGTSNLGPVSNVTITGGSNGQFLRTDGSGALTFANVDSTKIANGTSNVQIATANGNVQTYVNGAERFRVHANGANVTGTLQASNLNIAGQIDATYIQSAGQLYAGAQIVSEQPDGMPPFIVLSTTPVANLTVESAANATVAQTVSNAAQPNITSVGTLSNLTSQGTVNFTGASNVSLGAVGNLHITGGTTGQVLTTDGAGNLSFASAGGSDISNGTSNVAIDSANGSITMGVNGTANVITVDQTSLTVSGGLTVNDNVTLGNSTATLVGISGNLSVANIVAHTNTNLSMTAGSFTATLDYATGELTLPGNLTSIASVNVYGVETNNSNIGNLIVTATANLGSNANVKITGGSNGQYLQTDGAGNLSWATISTTGISSGTSNVNIASPNGDVTVSVDGTANALVIGDTGITTGNATVTGVITASNITAPSSTSMVFNTDAGVMTLAHTTGDLTVPGDVLTSANITANDITANATVQADTVNTGNFSANGANVSLGAVGNLHITGGSNGQALVTDGSGNLSFANVRVDAAGSNTYVQYNNNGNFAGSTTFTFDPSGAGTLTVNYGGGGTIWTDNVYVGSVVSTDEISASNANLGNAARANFFIGDGSQLTNLNANAINGNISNANYASYANLASFANTAYSVDGANVSGEVANANYAAYANIASTANSVDGANVVGQVANANFAAYANLASFANTAYSVDGANVVGQVANANYAAFANVASTSNSVDGANVIGQVANANYAAHANLASFANTAFSVDAANVVGTVANANYAAYAGNVTEAAQSNITSLGTLTGLTVSGTSDLGAIANVKVSGGSNGQFIQTDGAGNLTFTSLSTTSVTNGSSNVDIPTANGNVIISSAGNANVVVVSGSGVVVTGTLEAGNATLSDTTVSSLTGSSGNLTITAASGNNSVILAPTGTGTVDVGNVRITSLAEPTQATDAATKQYVDTVAEGLHVHASAAAATPATLASITSGTITYNNGTAGVGATLTTTGTYSNIDGVAINTAGTRIIVKNEANTAHNGIYEFTSSTVLTRASDFNTPAEMAGGDFIFVTGGTLYNSTGWVMTDAVTTVGTSPVQFQQFSGAGTYAAGSGLTLTGTTFSVNVDGTTTEISSGNVVVKANAVFTTPNIGAATGTSLVATGNVTGGNLTTGGAVTATGNVTGGNLTTAGAVSATGNVSGGNLTTSGAVSGGTLSVTGTSNLGAVGNVTITGGTSGQFIQTDGNGVLSFATIVTNGVSNGTSNVSIATANGNINMSVNGNANIVRVTGTGVNVAGYANITGILSAAPDNVRLSGGALSQTLYVNSNGGLEFDYVRGNGNITEIPFQTTNSRLIGSANFKWSDPSYGGGNNALLIGYGTDLAGNLYVGNGNVQFYNTNLTFSGSNSGNITGVRTFGANTVSAANLYATYSELGQIYKRGNILADGEVNIQMGAANGANFTPNLTISSNVNSNTVSYIRTYSNGVVIVGNAIGISGAVLVTGNVNASGYTVTADTFVGNISGILSNGTSNVRIPAANGNVNLSAAGNANVVVVTGTGANIAGTLNATGNANVGNLGTAGLITATGNVTGGNLVTGGVVSATGNVSGGNVTTAGVVTATGNVTGGNLVTGGVVSATGNISGGNLDSLNHLVVGNLANSDTKLRLTNSSGNSFIQTGNGTSNSSGNIIFAAYNQSTPRVTINTTSGNVTITGALDTTGNIAGGNISTAGVITATGNITGGNLMGPLANGNSNVRIAAANGNVTITAVGNTTMTVTGTGANVTGTGNFSGNVSAANFVGTLANGNSNVNMSSNGNVTIVATGSNAIIISNTSSNVTGNLLVTSNTAATSTTTGALIVTGGAGISGNLHAGNLFATGMTMGNLTVNSNITTSNLSVTGTATIAVANIGALTGNTANVTVNSNGYVSTFDSTGNVTLPNNVIVTETVFANAFDITSWANVDGNLVVVGTSNFTGNATFGNFSGTFANGTSNVRIPAANGNVTVSAAGNANILTVTGTGVNVAGTLNATGNANVGNIGAATGVFTANVTVTSNVTAGNFIGKFANGSGTDIHIPTANGNILFDVAGNANVVTVTGSGVNVAGTGNFSGNLSAGNISTAGVITATGNITGGNLMGPLANGNSNVRIAAANGNVTVTAVGNTVLTVTGTGANVSGTANITGNTAIGANLTVTSVVTADQFIASNNGNGQNFRIGDDVWLGDFNLLDGFAVTGVGNSQRGYIYFGNTYRDANLGGIGSFGRAGNGALTSNGAMTVIGNLTANHFIGKFANGNSNVDITSANGNVTVGVAGNANIAVFTGTGANVNGTLGVSGNLTAANLMGPLANGNSNVRIAAANGNVTVTAVGNTVLTVSGTGANVSGTANITGNTDIGGNLVVQGQIHTVVNNTGQNIKIGDDAWLGDLNLGGGFAVTGVSNSQVGYIYFGNTYKDGNLGGIGSFGRAGNGALTSNGAMTVIGNLTASNFIGKFANGTTDIDIPTANGNLVIDVAGNANIAVFTGTGANINGTLTVSGNLTAPNLMGALANGNSNVRIAAANGNVTVTSAGNTTLTVTGTGANVAGTLDITGNTTGTNFSANGNITASSNVITNSISSRTDANVTITAGATNRSVTIVPTGTGTVDVSSKRITSVAEPTASTDAATKAYVDSVAQGLHVHASVNAATTGNLATLTGGTVTYNNGTAGVGATLTLSVALTTLDGVTLSNGMRVLVKNEANTALNGIYDRTSSTVLTRSTDFDTGAEIAGGDFLFVTAGTLYNSTGWVQTDEVTTVGTDPIVFEQFSGGGTYSAGTGLTLNGTQFSISNTAVTAASYGNGDRVATFTVNAQGQLTAASNVVIAANAANLTGTTLASTIVTSSLTTVGTLGNLTVTGNASAGNLSTGGALSVTGNANVGNLGTAGLITATGNVSGGNLTTGGVVSATGNVTGGNLTTGGVVSATGNVTGGNLVTAGVVSATGTVTGGNLSTAGTLSVTGNANVGNLGTAGSISATGNITTSASLVSTVATGTAPIIVSSTTEVANLKAQYANVADTATTAGTVTTAAQPNITSVGTLTSLTVTGNVDGGNLTTGGVVSATGNVSGGNITTAGVVEATGNVSGGNITTAGVVEATGNVSGGNITTTGVVSATGNVSGGNLTTAGALNVTGDANVGNIGAASGIFTADISVAGTANVANFNANGAVSLGTVANVKVNGGANGQFLQTDGAGNLSWATLSSTSVVNGNSNVVVAANGNVTISSAGTANVVVVTDTGVNVAGTGNFSGNLSAGNVSATGVDAASVTATGNVSGNIVIATVADGTAPFVVTSTTMVSNLRAQYADSANTAGTVTTGAQPNITSVGTLSSLSVSGNVSGGNISTAGVANLANVQAGNVTVTGAVTTVDLTANGNVTLGTVANVKVTGGSNGQYLRTDGAGNLTFATVDASGIANGTSNISIPVANGNINFGVAGVANRVQITSSQLVVAPTLTGNFQGNLRSGNFNTGTIAATYIESAGQLVSGAQIISQQPDGTAPFIVYSTTPVANLTVESAANATVAQTVSNAAQPNITSVGTLTSLSVSGDVTAANVTSNGLVQTANANVTNTLTVATLSMTGVANLGAVANVKVTGGTAGQFLKTDGAGNLSFDTLSSTSISNGNSNVVVAANGNVTISSTGTANVVLVSDSGATVTGTLAASGNITSNANVITDNVLGRTGDVTITAASGNNSVRLVATGTGTVDVGNVRITSLATPSSDTDAATKAYVDSVAQGLDVKPSVKAATTTNITLSGTQTVDGVALVADDRVLVKNQITATQNGIYVVAAGSWTRSTDMDAGSDFPGAFTFVEGGTVNGDTGWVCTNDSVTLGSTSVVFTQFSGAGTYGAGTGLSLVGSTFSISNTAVTANTYGSNAKAVTFTVNAQGQLTAASEADITANANLLTGTTLASTVVTSSLTTVGTLTSLDVTGNITGNANITGGNLVTGGVVSATGNVTGDNLVANTTVTVGSTSVRAGTLTTTSIAANQVVATFSTAGVTGVEFLVKGVDASGSKYSIATVQAVTDGANVDYAIYGEVNIGATTGTLAVNISGGNIRLLVTPSSSNSTVWTTQIRVI